MSDITPPTNEALPKFPIPKGWNALYEQETKKVFVLREFPHGGMASSKLKLITKVTQAELMAEVQNLGLTWTPPIDTTKPSPSNTK
jgi:hypothetical protein